MSVGLTAKIPFSEIEKIEIYYNSSKKTMASIKNALGCDYIMNAGFYEMSKFKPVCGLVVDGKVLSDTTNMYGASIDKNKINFNKGNIPKYPYFVGANPAIIKEGKILNFQLQPGLVGRRGRSALGATKDALILRCLPDTSAAGITVQDLAKDLLSLGCVDAINLDGGGSSQCNFNGQVSNSARIVNNFICVWLKKKEVSTPTNKKTYKVTAGVLNVRSGPGTNYKIISSLLKGQTIESSKINGNWAYIDKLNGWASLTYLAAQNTSSSINNYKVTALALNIRKGPGTTYGSKGLLVKNAVVSVSKIQNGWAYIPAKDGWCSLSYLSKI